MKIGKIARRFRRVSNMIRLGSFREKVRLEVVERLPLHRITNRVIHKRQLECIAFQRIEKKYSDFFANAPEPRQKDDQEKGIPKIIWWCWLQGLEAAPEVVQTCLESVRRYMPDYELRLITEENFTDYVELPDYILDRRKNGLMSPNHFANLIRLELLLRYGGVWIDATVLLTGDGLRKILDQTEDLFMPRFVFNVRWLTAENWLIAARPDNDLLRLTRDAHWLYWKEHKLAVNYMFFFFFFSMAANRYPEQWRAVYPYCRENSFVLVKEMLLPYTEKRYSEIKEVTSFHKLTWKRDFVTEPGSFYDVLIHQRKF